MLGLALRIGLGDERAAQTITGVNQAKKTLALAHTHLYLIAFPQTNSERFSIPEIGIDLGDVDRARRRHAVDAHFRGIDRRAGFDLDCSAFCPPGGQMSLL